ncbi:TPA: hypothetical protein N0F65_005886 [Lagenidium giganteum]|uniref:SWIM-type domain-containing protein n=1 Tax=Lagenidium giganteum TaxID=4803 RepID=A0AAV2YKQ3_9STRA|nr:TPA: hypothetical protein N0F65_005886 [Lagenidium giganteum]
MTKARSRKRGADEGSADSAPSSRQRTNSDTKRRSPRLQAAIAQVRIASIIDDSDEEQTKRSEDTSENASENASDDEEQTQQSHDDESKPEAPVTQHVDETPAFTGPSNTAFLDGFGHEYPSWDEFTKAFDAFTASTFQCFPRRSSSSVTKRNEQVQQRQEARDGKPSKQKALPIHLGFYAVSFHCTHGIKHKSKSQGHRHHEVVRYTNCTARVNARVVEKVEDTYVIRVEALGGHNHPCNEDVYKQYPVARVVKDDNVLAIGKAMWESGASVKGIMRFFRSTTDKFPTMRDVHNQVQRRKDSIKKGLSDEERTEAFLKSFCTETGNRATIFVDDINRARTVAFQTKGMRRLFQVFPQVMMVDATHATNTNRCKLFSFVVEDIFGHGQYVHHALIDRESIENMEDAVNSFKTHNPRWNSVKMLLCQYHVIAFLEGQVSERFVGTVEQRAELKDVFGLLVKALTKQNLDEAEALLLERCGGSQAHPLYAYYDTNWRSIKDEWASYLRSDVPHLGNHTNNRNKSKWGKVKDLLGPKVTIDKAIATLEMLQNWCEEEYVTKLGRIGTRVPPQKDQGSVELRRLFSTISVHAYRKIGAEYRAADESKYRIRDLRELDRPLKENAIQLQRLSDYRTYTVSLSDFACTCWFDSIMLLPCRHVYVVRRHLNFETVVPFVHIGCCSHTPMTSPTGRCAKRRLSTSHPVHRLEA